jgi:hypothetical protein
LTRNIKPEFKKLLEEKNEKEGNEKRKKIQKKLKCQKNCIKITSKTIGK